MCFSPRWSAPQVLRVLLSENGVGLRVVKSCGWTRLGIADPMSPRLTGQRKDVWERILQMTLRYIVLIP